MVRETRFTWDETDGIEIPQPGERMADLDDELLDALAEERPRPPKPRPEESRERPVRRAASTDPRRHLADADWLRDEPDRLRPRP